MSVRYQISAPAVIGEVLDGEAIIVNLDSGAYYSLRDAGAVLWSLLHHQPTIAQLIQAICQHYAGDPAEIGASVASLLDQLEAEALVRTVDTPEDEASGTLASDPPSAPPPFAPPVLEKFTDMADLLLLDPIHEVDEAAGWPMPRS